MYWYHHQTLIAGGVLNLETHRCYHLVPSIVISHLRRSHASSWGHSRQRVTHLSFRTMFRRICHGHLLKGHSQGFAMAVTPFMQQRFLKSCKFKVGLRHTQRKTLPGNNGGSNVAMNMAAQMEYQRPPPPGNPPEVQQDHEPPPPSTENDSEVSGFDVNFDISMFWGEWGTALEPQVVQAPCWQAWGRTCLTMTLMCKKNKCAAVWCHSPWKE